MRVLCAAVSGPGHAYPMLAVAKALQQRGHEVVVALEERHRVAASSFSFVAFPELPQAEEEGFHPYAVARRIAQGFLPLLDHIAPDVAVIDLLTLGVALACDVRGIPWATLSVHPLHLPSRDLPPFGQGRSPARTFLGKKLQHRAQDRQLQSFWQGARECDEVRHQMGLKKLGRIDGSLSPSLLLVGTLACLEPPRSDWPRHAQVVGPCLFEPAAPDSAEPQGDGPLALVAASTAHEGVLLDASMQALRQLGMRAIVTTGASTGGVVTGDSRTLVVAEASHRAILQRAAVVVCNGGHGIVAKALIAGVPLVILPQHGDQKENGARVERTGAGLMVRKPSKLHGALRKVLQQPSFRSAALAISAAEATDGGANAAVLIEHWAKAKGGGQVPASLPNGGF